METPNHTEDELLTVAEAARFLRVSKSYLFKLTSSRAVPHVKIGRRVLFDREELIAWARSRRVAPVRETIEARR